MLVNLLTGIVRWSMSSENTPEKDDSLPGDSAIFYWPKLILAGVLVLFIATNIALVRSYRYEKRKRLELDKKYQVYKSSLESSGFQEVANWQAELLTWPIVEESAILIQQEKYSVALDKLNQIAAIGFARVPSAYFFRGQAFHALGKYQNAVEDFSKYYDVIASSHYALFFRAKSYLKLNKQQLAIEDLEQAIQHAGSFAEAETLLKTLK